jgi:hypothetical protein
MRTVDEIIAKLDTLTTAELQRLISAAQKIEAIHLKWQEPRISQDEAQPTGTYIKEYVRCGKPGCKTCSELGGHGPYWYHYSSEKGKTRKRYIGKNKPADAK